MKNNLFECPCCGKKFEAQNPELHHICEAWKLPYVPRTECKGKKMNTIQTMKITLYPINQKSIPEKSNNKKIMKKIKPNKQIDDSTDVRGSLQRLEAELCKTYLQDAGLLKIPKQKKHLTKKNMKIEFAEKEEKELKKLKMKQIKLTISTPPPSQNSCWRHAGRFTYKTPKYRDWQSYVHKHLELKNEIKDKPFKLELIQRWKSKRKRDLDNYLKPLLDTLEEKLFDNDNQLYELHVVKEIGCEEDEFILTFEY